MWFNQLKTIVFLATLTGMLMLIGGLFGGAQGVITSFIMALFMNGISYFYSDKIVLNMYGAKTLDKSRYGFIYDMVQDIANKANIPMPKLWLVDTPMANAFATGRDPKNASVAVTSGILGLLDQRELRGVLAHEISHIQNRDILIGTIAATIAGAIGFLANMAQRMAFWSSMSNNDRDRRNSPSVISLFLVSILMPIAATLVRLAISRSREYLADEHGAELSHDPLALASALEKLNAHIADAHLKENNGMQVATSHLFIVYPFLPKGFTALFSTHPSLQKRVAHLRKIYQDMQIGDQR